MSEINKLKKIALNSQLLYSERMSAIDTLGAFSSRDALSALLDIANEGLTYSERMTAQDYAMKITQVLINNKEI